MSFWKQVLYPVLLLGALIPASLSAESVFPSDFCSKLPQSDPKQFASYTQLAPDLAPYLEKMREIPLPVAQAMALTAVEKKMTALDFLTDDAFRGYCFYFISSTTLAGLDRGFHLRLFTISRGKDINEQRFYIDGMFLGRSRQFIFYNLPEVVTVDPEHPDNEVKFQQVVRQTTSRAGYLTFSGFTVDTPLGWLNMNSVEKSKDKTNTGTFSVGAFSADEPLKLITAK